MPKMRLICHLLRSRWSLVEIFWRVLEFRHFWQSVIRFQNRQSFTEEFQCFIFDQVAEIEKKFVGKYLCTKKYLFAM
jgi:hypothetical protein